MAQQITKWVANDGSEWRALADAEARDKLVDAIADVMAPLGRDRQLRDNQFIQHDPHSVLRCRVGILKLAAKEFPSFAIFRHEPLEVVHPMSAAGRILDDCGGPLCQAWNRFMRIDELGREWQQPYFAANPPADAECVLQTQEHKA